MTGVLLASGGLDSTLIAAKYRPSIHLFVQYGQRHSMAEHRASIAVAKYYGGEHLCADLPIGKFGQSALTGETGPLIGAPTVVPGRNAALITLAVSLAVARGLTDVAIGCNATDRAVYPDCRPEFLASIGHASSVAYGVNVHAPLLTWSKVRIGAELRRLEVPVDLTWSCYAGRNKPCGECGACLTRKEALGVHDH